MTRTHTQGEMAYIESKSAHGIPCRVYATAGKEAQGAFALDVCGKVLDFFDDYFGIPYPLPKMDMLAIPDFAAGAMENYGCVTCASVRESCCLPACLPACV
jgi:puromycin-sensitive aminopeptidase